MHYYYSINYKVKTLNMFVCRYKLIKSVIDSVVIHLTCIGLLIILLGYTCETVMIRCSYLKIFLQKQLKTL